MWRVAVGGGGSDFASPLLVSEDLLSFPHAAPVFSSQFTFNVKGISQFCLRENGLGAYDT